MENREMNNMLYHIREMLVWGNIVEMIDGDSLKRYTNGHIKQKDMILSSMGESFLDRLKELKLMGDTYDEQLVKEIQDSNRLDGVVSNANGGQCIWESRLIYDPDCDTNIKVYNTKCNNEFTIGGGLPSDMDFNYCPYCSKKINAIETEE